MIDRSKSRIVEKRTNRGGFPLSGKVVPSPGLHLARFTADPGDVQSCVAQRDSFHMVLTGATVPNLPPVDLLWTRQFPGDQERTHVFPAGILFGQVAKEREEAHRWTP